MSDSNDSQNTEKVKMSSERDQKVAEKLVETRQFDSGKEVRK